LKRISQVADDFLTTIDELIRGQKVWGTMREDLLIYRQDYVDGVLSEAGRRFVLDLARGGPAPTPSDNDSSGDRSKYAASAEKPPGVEHPQQLLEKARRQIETLKSRGRQALRERDAAEQSVKKLEAAVDQLGRERDAAVEKAKQLEATLGQRGTSQRLDRFRRARSEFARLYHPDQVKAEGIERVIRAEIFKEFWAVLERIERDS
jgi:hypothetical protein